MSIKIGLERSIELLKLIGNPQNNFKIIHVGGTNGKGSISSFIGSMLNSCSLKIGRYNSPHFIHEYDSIRIFEKTVSKQRYDKAREIVVKANAAHNLKASQFELLTATAFLCFSMEKVDVAIVEVGLGGRLDATNVCPDSLASVFSSIGIDHQAFLGNTVEEIASEKSGIIKDNVPVIIAPQSYNSAKEILCHQAKEHHSPCYLVSTSRKHPTKPNWAINTFFGQDFEYPLPLQGGFQLDNSAVAVKTVEVVIKQLIEQKIKPFSSISSYQDNLQVINEKIRKGLSEVKWPGRLEWLVHNKCGKVLLDGAHNTDCAYALKKYIDEYFESGISTQNHHSRPIQWIFGMTHGKDLEKVLDILVSPEDSVYCVPFRQPEQMTWIHCTPPKDIKETLLQKYQSQFTETELNVNAFACLKDIREKRMKKNGTEPLVVVCGSLYLVADIYQSLLLAV
ncbi:FolC bifunctional protein [Neocallimastix californiae]|uniref:Dihydrofolate synthetase n=1 Tax=Neocallimastix californiae TaxID=1754190 RepID=A0A1Y2C5A1_9FUNG|nr:FolC bifunctional protein [Neocallimastix californiae]|eukprot:ORY41495.1 FolC bifunctional protein [Neocallimastix californiae]